MRLAVTKRANRKQKMGWSDQEPFDSDERFNTVNSQWRAGRKSYSDPKPSPIKNVTLPWERGVKTSRRGEKIDTKPLSSFPRKTT